MGASTESRRLRRTRRLNKLSAARDAHHAALRAGLGYRGSGENGAMTVHTHSLAWHRAKNPNIAVPPEGHGWSRSGPVRQVHVSEGSVTLAVNSLRRSNRAADTATAAKTE